MEGWTCNSNKSINKAMGESADLADGSKPIT